MKARSRVGWTNRSRSLPTLLVGCFATWGCAGSANVPFETTPEHETSLIPGTDVWVVWTSPESVQSIKFYEASRKGESLVPGFDEFVALTEPPHVANCPVPKAPVGAEGVAAVVRIKALVLKDGSVGEARVEGCSYPNLGLERATLEAAMLCSYSPATQNGIPIAVWVTYSTEFHAKDR
jgi:TonB family protein